MKGQSPIDPIKLYSEWDIPKWNAWLYKCYVTKSVSLLVETKKNLQLGMDDLVKKNLNIEKVTVVFLRMQKSIDNTLKKIFRDENENPLYDPKNAHLKSQFIDDKKKKEIELERFLKSKSW